MAKEPNTENLAVLLTGGKQYLVRPGMKVRLEKLEQGPESKITFDQVLLTADGEKIELGAPFLKGAKVEGKITRHGRQDKVFGAKVKPKKRYKRYFGHKQHFTEVAIDNLAF